MRHAPTALTGAKPGMATHGRYEMTQQPKNHQGSGGYSAKHYIGQWVELASRRGAWCEVLDIGADGRICVSAGLYGYDGPTWINDSEAVGSLDDRRA